MGAPYVPSSIPETFRPVCCPAQCPEGPIKDDVRGGVSEPSAGHQALHLPMGNGTVTVAQSQAPRGWPGLPGAHILSLPARAGQLPWVVGVQALLSELEEPCWRAGGEVG